MLTLDTKNFPEGPERYAVPADRSFIFATGIENSYPTIRGRDGATVRVDQMAKSGHYDRWREDFGLVRELDIEYLRYGPPYHLTHLGPGRYDWSFADESRPVTAHGQAPQGVLVVPPGGCFLNAHTRRARLWS